MASTTRNIHTFLNKLSAIKEKMNVKTQKLISSAVAHTVLRALWMAPSPHFHHNMHIIYFSSLNRYFLISDNVSVFSIASGSLSVCWDTIKSMKGKTVAHPSQYTDLLWFQWILYQTTLNSEQPPPDFLLVHYLCPWPSMPRKCFQMLQNFMWISLHHLLETGHSMLEM